jgi:hypothetical protein
VRSLVGLPNSWSGGGLGDLAGVEEAGAIGELAGEVHLVGDHEHGWVVLGPDTLSDCTDITTPQLIGAWDGQSGRSSIVRGDQGASAAPRGVAPAEPGGGGARHPGAGGGESAGPSAEAERFPDWFIRMTRPGIDLDEAIDENHPPFLPGLQGDA